jgi:hypothetical protein
VSGIFAGAQQEYAEHHIATFPVGTDKRPAITNYQRVGLPGSANLAAKFGNASGLGFMTNARNRIAVLDVDSTDERVFADALSRYGETPIKVQTGSGKFHGLYRFNGERRRIRPVGEAPIDILGTGGYVIAPPSVTAKGMYRFIEGGLDDLDKLPVMRGLPPEAYGQQKPLLTSTRPREVEGGRNNAAFDHCMRVAAKTRCLNLSNEDGFNLVLGAAHEFNAKCLLPSLKEDEVVKIAQSAWNYEQRGDNRFGQPWVIFSIIEADHLIRGDTDLFLLLSFLKTHNGPNSEFLIANGLSEIFRWSRQRLASTRHRLEEQGYVRQTKPATRYTGAALYKWAPKSRVSNI